MSIERTTLWKLTIGMSIISIYVVYVYFEKKYQRYRIDNELWNRTLQKIYQKLQRIEDMLTIAPTTAVEPTVTPVVAPVTISTVPCSFVPLDVKTDTNIIRDHTQPIVHRSNERPNERP